MISTSKPHAKHLFAGRNTQHSPLKAIFLTPILTMATSEMVGAVLAGGSTFSFSRNSFKLNFIILKSGKSGVEKLKQIKYTINILKLLTTSRSSVKQIFSICSIFVNLWNTGLETQVEKCPSSPHPLPPPPTQPPEIIWKFFVKLTVLI